MAKIAVVFLLFAIVAVCNAGRLTRETASPVPPTLDEAFKPIIEGIKKLGSEQNIKGLQDELNRFGEQFKKDGAEAWKKVQSFTSDVIVAAQKQLDDKPKA